MHLQLSASTLFCFLCSSAVVLLNVKSGHPYVASCHGFPSHSQVEPGILTAPPLPPRGLRDTAMLPLRSSPPHYPHWLANSSACSGRACCSHPPAPPRMSSGSHPLLDSRISAQTGCPWPPCLSPSALHTGLCFFLTLVFSLTGSVSVALPRMWAAWEQGGGLFSLFPAVSLDPRAVQREGTKEVSGGWISGWCTDWMNCEN